MSGDAALVLLMGVIRATLEMAGPILLVSLIAGVLVGIAQTATQVNESSISYVVKVGATVLLLLAIGPVLAARVVTYTRTSLQAVETVVR